MQCELGELTSMFWKTAFVTPHSPTADLGICGVLASIVSWRFMRCWAAFLPADVFEALGDGFCSGDSGCAARSFEREIYS